MGLADQPAIEVWVFYATPDAQTLVRLELPRGGTAGDAVMLSGLLPQFPEMGSRPRLGRYGSCIDWATPLESQDRVEILRPLTADPKEARRRRAEVQRRRRHSAAQG